MWYGEVGQLTTTKKYAGPGVRTPLNLPAPILGDETGGALADDMLDKLNAGARLVFAIFHHPNSRDLFASPLMTKSLREAYLAAAKLWGI